MPSPRATDDRLPTGRTLADGVVEPMVSNVREIRKTTWEARAGLVAVSHDEGVVPR